VFTSRDEIITLLTELGARLDSRGLEVELYIVGGAAMMLGYDRSSVTRDIDALITPGGVIDEVVEEMANERGNLPPDWLNSRVVPLLPRLADSRSWEMLHVPGLSVEVASAEHLLAMKARAGRSLRDLQDVAVLCEILELRFVDQVWQTCDRVWGGGMIRPEVRATITEFLVARGLTEE
jgi:predicted nucleotidyltransferase